MGVVVNLTSPYQTYRARFAAHFLQAILISAMLGLFCNDVFALEIQGIQTDQKSMYAGKAVQIQVDFDQTYAENQSCGLEVNYGDGDTQSMRTGKDLPLKLSHTYASPGQYVVTIQGKTVFRGLKSALPCGGNKKQLALNVVSNPTQRDAVAAAPRTENTPVPVSSAAKQQVIDTIKSFRLETIASPIQALGKYSNDAALQNLTLIENALFTETPPDVGWRYLFSTATYTVVPITEQASVVLFYHPWSDTAINTLWQLENNRPVMIRAELVLGDYIRQSGRPPFTLQPLWERDSGRIPPLLSAQIAVGETLAAFEKALPANGKIESGTVFAKQLAGLTKGTKTREITQGMSTAANVRFERAITSLVRYEQDKKFEPYRELTTLLLAGIKSDDFSLLKPTIPQTNQETYDFIKANTSAIGLFKVVATLRTPNDCFVFLSQPVDPNNVLALWMQTDNGQYGLRQAQLINHIFSATYVDQIKELVRKVSQP